MRERGGVVESRCSRAMDVDDGGDGCDGGDGVCVDGGWSEWPVNQVFTHLR